MIVGRIQHGQVEFDSPLPGEWEGMMVRVEPCSPDDTVDLAARIAALHALGPMEYETGERERTRRELDAVDRLSREQMLHLADPMP
jgi:hypothetical protein